MVYDNFNRRRLTSPATCKPMKGKPFFMACIWTGALGLAFLVGFVTRAPAPAPASPPPDAAVATEPQSLQIQEPISRVERPENSPHEPPITVFTSADDLEFRESFARLLPQIAAIGAHDDLFVLADVWAAQNPKVAVNWIAGLEFNDERNPFLYSALSRWATDDFDAARDWLQALPDDFPVSGEYLSAAMIRGLASQDPKRALNMLLAMPNGPERNGSVDFLVSAWRDDGLQEAMNNVAQLPSSSRAMKERAIGQLLDTLAPDEIPAAAEWASSLPARNDRVAAHSALAARWARETPPAAAAWAGELPERAVRTRALGEAGTRWARLDPTTASDWLESHAGKPDFDLAARSVAWTTVGLTPERAMDQVAGITNPQLRHESFEQILRFWTAEQPDAALALLEEDERIPSDIKRQILTWFE